VAPRANSPSLRVSVHVNPGSRRRHVGGERGGSLVVHVGARAVEGAATEETLAMVASAFGVRASAVSLERGAHRREKVVVIEGDVEALRARLAQLLVGES
jgi:uncharacterized protein